MLVVEVEFTGYGDEVRCGVDEPEQLAESHDDEFVGDEGALLIV